MRLNETRVVLMNMGNLKRGEGKERKILFLKKNMRSIDEAFCMSCCGQQIICLTRH